MKPRTGEAVGVCGCLYHEKQAGHQARADARSRGLSKLGCFIGRGACTTREGGCVRAREGEMAFGGPYAASRSSTGYRGTGGTDMEMTPLLLTDGLC